MMPPQEGNAQNCTVTRLVDLQGRPMSWDALYATVERYYRPPKIRRSLGEQIMEVLQAQGNSTALEVAIVLAPLFSYTSVSMRMRELWVMRQLERSPRRRTARGGPAYEYVYGPVGS